MIKTEKKKKQLYPDYKPDNLESKKEKIICKICGQKTLEITEHGTVFDGKCSNEACRFYCWNKIFEFYEKEVEKNYPKKEKKVGNGEPSYTR